MSRAKGTRIELKGWTKDDIERVNQTSLPQIWRW